MSEREFFITVNVPIAVKVRCVADGEGSATVFKVISCLPPEPYEVMAGIDAAGDFETLDRLYSEAAHD